MKIVMAFGAFDGIHTGHLHYLKQAKKSGRLIVAIARDKSKWKFSRRYGLPEKERAHLVKELNIADKVVLGGEKDAFEKIIKIKPDIIAISAYTPVNKTNLEYDLKKRGLKTKVKIIKAYKPKIYNEHFKINPKNLLGLPRK